MLTRKFWRDAAERSLSTAAQSALLVFGANQINAVDANWADVGGFALGGFVLSLLKAMAAARVGADDSASLDPAV